MNAFLIPIHRHSSVAYIQYKGTYLASVDIVLNNRGYTYYTLYTTKYLTGLLMTFMRSRPNTNPNVIVIVRPKY